jgi:hypothetical protein
MSRRKMKSSSGPRYALQALLALTLCPLGACTKGSPSAPTYTMGLTPPTEEQHGTIEPHAVAYFTFTTNRLGAVKLAVWPQQPTVPPPLPVLYLTLRAGRCPDACGDRIADSTRDPVVALVPAGTYSLIVGNPNDQAVSFALVMDYAK